MLEKEVKVVKTKEIEPVELSERYRAIRLIIRSREGSDKIRLGIRDSDSSCEYSWYYQENDECLYVLSGRATIFWEDPKGRRGKIESGEGDAVFLPSTFKYHRVNDARSGCKLIYAVSPPII